MQMYTNKADEKKIIAFFFRPLRISLMLSSYIGFGL